MTPVEMVGLVARARELPVPAQKWAEWVLDIAPFAGKRAQSFERTVLHRDVMLFRDPRVGAARKKLIVAFSGACLRLDMPLPSVLQSLPSKQVDVVLLRDRTMRHYLSGIGDYASDMVGIAAGIERDVRPGRYSDIYAYGTSMGGFAAVRYALFQRLRRAVAVGGRFPSHPRRLVKEPAHAMPAFDPLCDCVSRAAKTEFVAVRGEGYERDQWHSELLGHIRLVRHVAVPLPTHNVAYELAKSGRLAAFFADMFDLDGQASGARDAWLGLPASVALPIVSAA
jgi:hypothetical protein